MAMPKAFGVLLPVLILAVALVACASPRQAFAGNPDLPFSKAVLVGDTLYVAGHLGLDPETGMPPSDPGEEVRLLLDAFAETLTRAGATMDDLVQVQLYCSDVGLYDVFNAIYRTRFKQQFPARAFIGSGKLLRGARFEIIGIAVLP